MFCLKTMRRSCIVLLALSAMAMAMAKADGPRGLALFDEADRLEREGKLAEACERYAGSQRELPRPVTLYRLADCLERQGRIASAWAMFRQAKSASEAVGAEGGPNGEKERRRAVEAGKQAERLAPRITRLEVDVPAVVASIEGLRVTRSGEPVPRSEWGLALPIDPGLVTLEATAPGRVPWRTERNVTGEGATIIVEVPLLSPAPAPAAAPSATANAVEPTRPAAATPPPIADARGRKSTQRIVGVASAATGVLTAGIGAGLWIWGQRGMTSTTCTGSPPACPRDEDTIAFNSARSHALVGRWLVIGGAALSVGGLVLWATTPRPTESSVADRRLRLVVVPGGLTVAGEF